jgi:hypothetical protein
MIVLIITTGSYSSQMTLNPVIYMAISKELNKPTEGVYSLFYSSRHNTQKESTIPREKEHMAVNEGLSAISLIFCLQNIPYMAIKCS